MDDRPASRRARAREARERAAVARREAQFQGFYDGLTSSTASVIARAGHAISTAEPEKYLALSQQAAKTAARPGTADFLPRPLKALLRAQSAEGKWDAASAQHGAAVRNVLCGLSAGDTSGRATLPDPPEGISSWRWSTALVCEFLRRHPQYFAFTQDAYSKGKQWCAGDEQLVSSAATSLPGSMLSKPLAYALDETQVRSGRWKSALDSLVEARGYLASIAATARYDSAKARERDIRETLHPRSKAAAAAPRAGASAAAPPGSPLRAATAASVTFREGTPHFERLGSAASPSGGRRPDFARGSRDAASDSPSVAASDALSDASGATATTFSSIASAANEAAAAVLSGAVDMNANPAEWDALTMLDTALNGRRGARSERERKALRRERALEAKQTAGLEFEFAALLGGADADALASTFAAGDSAAVSLGGGSSGGVSPQRSSALLELAARWSVPLTQKEELARLHTLRAPGAEKEGSEVSPSAGSHTSNAARASARRRRKAAVAAAPDGGWNSRTVVHRRRFIDDRLPRDGGERESRARGRRSGRGRAGGGRSAANKSGAQGKERGGHRKRSDSGGDAEERCGGAEGGGGAPGGGSPASTSSRSSRLLSPEERAAAAIAAAKAEEKEARATEAAQRTAQVDTSGMEMSEMLALTEALMTLDRHIAQARAIANVAAPAFAAAITHMERANAFSPLTDLLRAEVRPAVVRAVRCVLLWREQVDRTAAKLRSERMASLAASGLHPHVIASKMAVEDAATAAQYVLPVMMWHGQNALIWLIQSLDWLQDVPGLRMFLGDDFPLRRNPFGMHNSLENRPATPKPVYETAILDGKEVQMKSAMKQMQLEKDERAMRIWRSLFEPRTLPLSAPWWPSVGMTPQEIDTVREYEKVLLREEELHRANQERLAAALAGDVSPLPGGGGGGGDDAANANETLLRSP
jgi:hypothetical protein